MAKQLELLYKCRCMTEEKSLYMRERKPDEDIINYMEDVQRKVGAEHKKLSPLCRATALEYLKLPVEGERIGDVNGGTA